MPRKNPKIRKIKRADETRAWVIGLVSQAPKALGVTAGRGQGEYWSLGVLREYVKKHGAALGHFAAEKRLRRWLAAPELKELKYWRPGDPRPRVAVSKAAALKESQGLPALAKGQLRAGKSANGFGHRGEDEAAPKVSLPTVYFARRPELPISDRERQGADYKARSPREEIKRTEDEILAEGEAALRRIRGAMPMRDWIAIGKALLVLRKRAMAETDAEKPRGILYVRRNGALLRQHGFLTISKSARQTAMLVVENLAAIEQWLAKLPDERRLSLNHPMCVWRSYLAAKKRDGHSSKGAWRDRRTMPEEDFARLVEAMTESLETHDPIQLAIAAARALGYAIPRRVFCGKHDYVRRPQPVMPWSPFELSLA
jgi:hypothetical protein